MTSPTYLTLNDIAAAVGRSRSAIDYAFKDGDLPEPDFRQGRIIVWKSERLGQIVTMLRERAERGRQRLETRDLAFA